MTFRTEHFLSKQNSFTVYSMFYFKRILYIFKVYKIIRKHSEKGKIKIRAV